MIKVHSGAIKIFPKLTKNYSIQIINAYCFHWSQEAISFSPNSSDVSSSGQKFKLYWHSSATNGAWPRQKPHTPTIGGGAQK